MSLNGLDHARVAEAYQAALAEAGGWFLLKYVSRDAVDVLARGTGGAAEARGAIAQYDDASPLYGFVLYRRRKVLIKFVPDATSRLLQARVAVHFTAVEEKFTPHDTTISITTPDELSDSALASACSLHTAAPSSSSSSSSSRRNKLDEISEDVEEGQATASDVVVPPRPDTAPASVPAVPPPAAPSEPKVLEVVPDEPEPATTRAPVEVKRAPEATPAPEPAQNAAAAVVEQEETRPEPPPEPLLELPPDASASYRDSLKQYDALFENGPDPRLSSQTARPTYSELYAEYYAQYSKPKVKLGPRPRPSLDSKRPKTSGNGELSVARPISSLPAGMRAAGKKTAEPKRSKARDTSVVPSIAFPAVPPPPPIPDIPQSPIYPSHRPASVKSMPSHGSRSHGISPEKQRLMKALELRKKQLKARQEREEMEAEEAKVEGEAEVLIAVPEEQSPAADEPPTTPSSSGDTVMESSSFGAETEDGASQRADDGLLEDHAAQHADSDLPEDDATQHTDSDLPSDTTQHADNDLPEDDAKSTTREDSSLEMTSSHAETDDLHSAMSASSPTSAQTHGSSCAPSTRPSSIAEEDHELPEADIKADATDSTESVESTPTVVPETEAPIPSVEVVPQPPAPETEVEASSSDVATKKSRRESMILMPPHQPSDSSSRRKSRRESMIFAPLDETAQQKLEPTSVSSKRQSFIEVKEKRRAVVSPIQIHLSAENSDAEYLSDDSFMEELQSAKFEHAKPVSVSKSPVTPYFPRKMPGSEALTPQRSPANTLKSVRLSPESSTRKISGTWPPQSTADPVVLAKKINVSSGISQRIKALAEKSNSRDSLVLVSPNASPDTTKSIAQRKSSFFSKTPPSGNSPNAKPLQRLNRASFVPVPFSTTPDRPPVPQPPKTADPAVYNVQQEPAKPDSVQVTARIVRDPRVQKPTLTMPTEGAPLDLHQSPIIIDHQKSTRPPSRSSRQSPTKMEPASPSSNAPRSSSESSWRSFGRRMSESKISALPRSQSSHSLESGEEKHDKKDKKEKKDSRTTKLFKRMSTISSISRKTQAGASPSVHEEDRQLTSLPSLREPPPAVQVGDLNIQFPDTLLWKRRWVEIDASGNFVLSMSKSNEQSKALTKRYHLSEFRAPYTPDQDRQELPYSVVLDFVDGRTLQCACETFASQVQVLQVLREAHDAWLAYNQHV